MLCLRFTAFCNGFKGILTTVCTVCTNHHVHPTTVYTNHGLHQATVYSNHRLHQPPFTPNQGSCQPPFTPHHRLQQPPFAPHHLHQITVCTDHRLHPTAVCANHSLQHQPQLVHIKPRFLPITACYRTRPCVFLPQLSHLTPSARALSIMQTSTDPLATDPFPQLQYLDFSKS